MTPVAQQITRPLLSALDSRVRRNVARRIDAMERELAFLVAREDRNVAYLRRRGWTNDRIHVLFALNSVYQQVLGPIQAATRGGPDGLGREIPVRYGNTSYDAASARAASSALRDFYALVAELRVPPDWLYANTCGEVVFRIAKFEEETLGN